eukprot:6394053-Alexandrium_andersonii.AAC.1
MAPGAGGGVRPIRAPGTPATDPGVERGRQGAPQTLEGQGGKAKGKAGRGAAQSVGPAPRWRRREVDPAG